MENYVEIKILPDPEFPASTLMNALFNKLHKALFDLHSKQIGVSFPDYAKTLGQTLRLHGSEINLQKLEALDWIGRMKDYCKNSGIQPVPANVQYRTVSRIQDKQTNAKLRRLIKRGFDDKEKIAEYQKKMQQEYQKGPYLELKSSEGQHYRRYIVLGELLEKPIAGEFNQFGLSKTATIPWF